MIRFDRLPLPCHGNRIWRNLTFPVTLKGGRQVWKSRTVLSETAKNRAKMIVAYIHDTLGGPPEPMLGPVMIQGYWHPTKNRNGRIPDADAMTKHLMDCLQKAGVYADDNQVAASPMLERLEPRKKGFMCIEIWEVR